MSMNDTVADFLTRVRNAQMAKHRYTTVLYSKLVKAMLEVMQKEGFVESFEASEDERSIRVYLKYNKKREPVIKGLRRISRPGVRRYVGNDKIPYVFRGLGVSLLTTSKGVMTGSEARKQNVGGEVLCYIW